MQTGEIIAGIEWEGTQLNGVQKSRVTPNRLEHILHK